MVEINESKQDLGMFGESHVSWMRIIIILIGVLFLVLLLSDELFLDEASASTDWGDDMQPGVTYKGYVSYGAAHCTGEFNAEPNSWYVVAGQRRSGGSSYFRFYLSADYTRYKDLYLTGELGPLAINGYNLGGEEVTNIMCQPGPNSNGDFWTQYLSGHHIKKFDYFDYGNQMEFYELWTADDMIHAYELYIPEGKVFQMTSGSWQSGHDFDYWLFTPSEKVCTQVYADKADSFDNRYISTISGYHLIVLSTEIRPTTPKTVLKISIESAENEFKMHVEDVGIFPSSGQSTELTLNKLYAEIETPECGDVVTFHANIANLADRSVTDIPVHFYLDDPNSGEFLAERNIKSLDGMFQIDVSFDWDTGYYPAGYYDIYAVVDPENEIREEIPYENNVWMTTIRVSVGGGGGGGSVIFPRIRSTMPNDGETDVSISTTIDIKFSKNIDSTLIDENLRLLCGGIPVDFTYYYSPGDRTLKIYPDGNLNYDTTYTIEVDTGLKDTSGNPFDGNGNRKYDGSPEDDYSFSFKTEKMEEVKDVYFYPDLMIYDPIIYPVNANEGDRVWVNVTVRAWKGFTIKYKNSNAKSVQVEYTFDDWGTSTTENMEALPGKIFEYKGTGNFNIGDRLGYKFIIVTNDPSENYKTTEQEFVDITDLPDLKNVDIKYDYTNMENWTRIENLDYEKAVKVNLSGILPASYEVLIEIDPENNISEIDEDNNALKVGGQANLLTQRMLDYLNSFDNPFIYYDKYWIKENGVYNVDNANFNWVDYAQNNVAKKNIADVDNDLIPVEERDIWMQIFPAWGGIGADSFGFDGNAWYGKENYPPWLHANWEIIIELLDAIKCSQAIDFLFDSGITDELIDFLTNYQIKFFVDGVYYQAPIRYVEAINGEEAHVEILQKIPVRFTLPDPLPNEISATVKSKFKYFLDGHTELDFEQLDIGLTFELPGIELEGSFEDIPVIGKIDFEITFATSLKIILGASGTGITAGAQFSFTPRLKLITDDINIFGIASIEDPKFDILVANPEGKVTVNLEIIFPFNDGTMTMPLTDQRFEVEKFNPVYNFYISELSGKLIFSGVIKTPISYDKFDIRQEFKLLDAFHRQSETKFSIGSPVSIDVYNGTGNFVGTSGSTINGSYYVEGDNHSKYIYLDSSQDKVNIGIVGEDNGTYNLTVERWMPILLENGVIHYVNFVYGIKNISTTLDELDYFNFDFKQLEKMLQEEYDKTGNVSKALENLKESLDLDYDGIPDYNDTELNFTKNGTSLYIQNANFIDEDGEMNLELLVRLAHLNESIPNKPLNLSIDGTMLSDANATTNETGIAQFSVILPSEYLSKNIDCLVEFIEDVNNLSSNDTVYLMVPYPEFGVEIVNLSNEEIVNETIELDCFLVNEYLENISIYLDDEFLSESYPYSLNTENISDGFHLIKVVANSTFNTSAYNQKWIIVDNLKPEIFNVSESVSNESGGVNYIAEIHWMTSELCKGRIHVSPDKENWFEISEELYSFNQTLTVENLDVGKYYFWIEANDSAGNLIVDNNNSKYYEFIVGNFPDLCVNDMKFNIFEPQVGDFVKISANISNIGKNSAKNVLIGLSIDESSLEQYVLIVKIEKKETYTVEFNWTAIFGSHFIQIIVDPFNSIDEINKTNNKVENHLVVSQIPEKVVDIEILNLHFEQTIYENVAINFTAKIKNNGETELTNIFVTFFIDENKFDEVRIEYLLAGNSTDIEIQTSFSAGTYNITCIVDYYDLIPEFNENNNRIELPIDVPQEPIKIVDLEILDLHFNPTVPYENKPIKITADIKNSGEVELRNIFVTFFAGDKKLEELKIEYLSPGNSSIIQTQSSLSAGTYNIKCVVDYYDLILESDENNNKIENPINVLTEPEKTVDLEILDFRHDQDVYDNKAITFTADIKNSGETEIRNIFVTFFAGDKKLDELKIDFLLPGISTNVKIQTTLSAGTYNVTCIIDYYDLIPETNENNNEVFLEVHVKGTDLGTFDLKIANVATDTSLYNESKIIILTATLTNIGEIDCRNVPVCVYDNERLLERKEITLPSNSTLDVIFNLVLTDGYRNLTVRVNGENDFPEKDMSNNEHSVDLFLSSESSKTPSDDDKKDESHDLEIVISIVIIGFIIIIIIVFIGFKNMIVSQKSVLKDGSKSSEIKKTMDDDKSILEDEPQEED